jgi:hypothetical protein
MLPSLEVKEKCPERENQQILVTPWSIHAYAWSNAAWKKMVRGQISFCPLRGFSGSFRRREVSVLGFRPVVLWSDALIYLLLLGGGM